MAMKSQGLKKSKNEENDVKSLGYLTIKSQLDMVISRKVHDFDLFTGFILGIKANSSSTMISAFIKSIPMITRHTNCVTNFKFNFVTSFWIVIHYNDLLVLILTTKIPNVV